MLLLIELIGIVGGLIALTNGRFTWGTQKHVQGTPARLIGLVLITPFPLAFSIGFLIGSWHASNNKPVDPDLVSRLMLGEVCLVGAAVLLTVLIAWIYGAEDPEEVWLLSDVPPRTPQPEFNPFEDQEPEPPVPPKPAYAHLIVNSSAPIRPLVAEHPQPEEPAGQGSKVLTFCAVIVVVGVLGLAMVVMSILNEPEPVPLQATVQTPPPEKQRERLKGELDPAKQIPPRPINYRLPELPDPLPISVSPIKKETVFELPQKIVDARVGGGGRYLILYARDAGKFFIFDTSAAEITQTIPVPNREATIRFTAGMNHLLVLVVDFRTIHRFRLADGKSEFTAKLDIPANPVDAFCMGHASAGPLLVGCRGEEVRLYDIEKCNRIPLPEIPLLPQTDFSNGLRGMTQDQYWAGATGRIFGALRKHHGTGYGETLIVNNGTICRYWPMHMRMNFFDSSLLPTPDEKMVYIPGIAVMTPELTKKIGYFDQESTMSRDSSDFQFFPACHGPFYVDAKKFAYRQGKSGLQIGGVRIFKYGEAQSICDIPKTPMFNEKRVYTKDTISPEHRLHLIPDARLLVIVSEDQEKLHLYPIDFDARIHHFCDEKGLCITSLPTLKAEIGQKYTYQVATFGDGPIRYTLEQAPEGMVIDWETGLIEWTPKKDFSGTKGSVVIVVNAAYGWKAKQKFELTLEKAR